MPIIPCYFLWEELWLKNMVNKVDLENGILIETPGDSFFLAKADFPQPDNPDDKYDVEGKIQVMLDAYANKRFFPIIFIFSLSPLSYNVFVVNEKSEIPDDSWRH